MKLGSQPDRPVLLKEQEWAVALSNQGRPGLLCSGKEGTVVKATLKLSFHNGKERMKWTEEERILQANGMACGSTGLMTPHV